MLAASGWASPAGWLRRGGADPDAGDPWISATAPNRHAFRRHCRSGAFRRRMSRAAAHLLLGRTAAGTLKLECDSRATFGSMPKLRISSTPSGRSRRSPRHWASRSPGVGDDEHARTAACSRGEQAGVRSLDPETWRRCWCAAPVQIAPRHRPGAAAYSRSASSHFAWLHAESGVTPSRPATHGRSTRNRGNGVGSVLTTRNRPAAGGGQFLQARLR